MLLPPFRAVHSQCDVSSRSPWDRISQRPNRSHPNYYHPPTFVIPTYRPTHQHPHIAASDTFPTSCTHDALPSHEQTYLPYPTDSISPPTIALSHPGACASTSCSFLSYLFFLFCTSAERQGNSPCIGGLAFHTAASAICRYSVLSLCLPNFIKPYSPL